MPVSVAHPILRSDPIGGHSFAILVRGVVRGWFTECSSITVEREVVAHAEGGVNHFEHQLPGGIRRANVTLKHGLAGAELWDWFQAGRMTGQVERRHLSIIIFNAMLIPVSWWDLPDAYPVKWSGSGLNTGGKEAAIETVEFAYGGSGSGRKSIQRSVDPTPAEPDEVTPDVDLSALAKKIYALLKHDLQVERERLGYKS